MQNPFESGHIKNYILLYVSVVVIMILFFIAATLFRDVNINSSIESWTSTEVNRLEESSLESNSRKKNTNNQQKEGFKPKFKLLEKNY
jgi:hypothetical protein